MSGGSWGYVYQRIEESAERLLEDRSILRRAFGKHLLKVALAMHDIEWVDSGDCSKDKEEIAIRIALGENAKREELSVLKEEAGRLIVELGKFTN